MTNPRKRKIRSAKQNAVPRRRGDVRATGERRVTNEYVELARSESSMLPVLHLLYGDDIGQSDGEPLWYDVLLGNEGYKQSPVNGDNWDYLLSVFETWDAKCQGEHAVCAQRLKISAQFLPTRLLKIDCGTGGDTVTRLVLTEYLEEKNIRYMTLSHRWGPQELMSSTTSENVEERFSSVQGLPFTFHQAAQLTKKLNISYLWIDSLCIIQNDSSDKEREIAMMAEIYSNSFCNIVASAASDPTQGCYNPERLDTVSAFPMRMTRQGPGLSPTVLLQRADRTLDELSSGRESGTLGERGWLVQERHLPERAIILTPRCLIWKCRATEAVKDYPDPDRIYAVKSDANPSEVFACPRLPLSRSIKFGEVIHRHNNNPMDIYSGWLRLAEEYAEKQLTVATDKLPAIGGLAKKIGHLTEDQYLAGLWKRDLVRGLCWMQTEKQQLTWLPTDDLNEWGIFPDGTPSWSWAALNLKVRYPEFDEIRNLSKCFRSAASPDIISAMTNPITGDQFGGVASGSITVRGSTISVEPLLPHGGLIILPLSAPVYRQEVSKRVRIYDQLGQVAGLIVLDRPTWTLGLVQRAHCAMTIKCLRLWGFETKSVSVLEDDNASWECKLIGLALRLVEAEKKAYQRIGMVYWLPRANEELFTNSAAEEEITLI